MSVTQKPSTVGTLKLSSLCQHGFEQASYHTGDAQRVTKVSLAQEEQIIDREKSFAEVQSESWWLDLGARA